MSDKAMFGAGCFWGVEAMFRQIKGVLKTAVGYSGGTLKSPTYEDVCTGKTGHAEVVMVEYDSSKVSYAQLVDAFWKGHNPTTLNRQGPDIGSQYRSAIFFYTSDQQQEALTSKEKLETSHQYNKPVVTQIVPAGDFYLAEDYHQQYLEKRGQSSCHI